MTKACGPLSLRPSHFKISRSDRYLLLPLLKGSWGYKPPRSILFLVKPIEETVFIKTFKTKFFLPCTLVGSIIQAEPYSYKGDQVITRNESSSSLGLWMRGYKPDAGRTLKRLNGIMKLYQSCIKMHFCGRQEKIPWRRKWQPTPVFLPGESHGWRSLVGYSPWGRKELDMTEREKRKKRVS